MSINLICQSIFHLSFITESFFFLTFFPFATELFKLLILPFTLNKIIVRPKIEQIAYLYLHLIFL